MDTDRYPWVIPAAVMIVVGSLSAVILIVVLVLMHGLFDDKVDNKAIFATIGPAFSTIVGAFAGLMGALSGYIAGKKAGASEGTS